MFLLSIDKANCNKKKKKSNVKTRFKIGKNTNHLYSINFVASTLDEHLI